MRQFIIVGRDVPTTGDFSLDSLTEAGRMDLLARCVTASLLLSHGIRDDVRTHLVLRDEFTIRFDGSELRGLHPDERSTAALIRNALGERAEAIGHIPVEVSAGVSLFRMGFEETLDSVEEDGVICQLHPDGETKADAPVPENPVFVLSNHEPLSEADAAVLERYVDQRISLGPRALHADHAIAVTHNWLDLAGHSE